MNNNGIQIGIADDQAKDFDFEKTEMKYDSTGMFHWSSAKSLEECILVSKSIAYMYSITASKKKKKKIHLRRILSLYDIYRCAPTLASQARWWRM